MLENTGTSVIGCHDRLVDIEPESQSQWLDSVSNVVSGVEVGVAGVSAIGAMEESFVSCSDFSAMAAIFGGIFGANVDNRTTVLQSLVFDKILQLPEGPRMEGPVESSALIGADIFEILQGYDISWCQTAYNFLTDTMVLAPHKTCPSAGHSLKVPFGRLRSFALQGGDNLLMPEHLRYDAPVELSIGGNGKVLDSDINAENTFVLSRAYVDINVFGKAQTEKQSS